MTTPTPTDIPAPPAVPDLDTLRFQDLVDTAKRLLPTRAPRWSDHNVSDPGITLIEYAAHLTDHLSYRCNTLPPGALRALLTLYGATPAMALPARAHLTLTTNQVPDNGLTIPAGTTVTGPDNIDFITTEPAHLTTTTTLIIGTGTAGYSGDGGPAHHAQLNTPRNPFLATDGSIYLHDSANHRTRRVTPTGTITTHPPGQPLPPPSTTQPPFTLNTHRVTVTYATHPTPILAIQATPLREHR
ncbi:hypothetical protein [Nocardia terpenica]|uniref:Baseplate assembly protein n=1 Tax=Nocardia terpenica TaxID=455432 RepID=A0A6G9ZDD9_9NOCA|nr:hypothetical protein [Nocardia terpenica]QIS23522.1 hypothetical protein F6W96_39760 [Nocardia terpenica]